MKLKIKKLHPEAVIPRYATDGSAGFDLVSVEDVYIKPGETKLVPIGIAVAVDPGYELSVRPRSGISLKTPLRVSNSPGVVDSDYRGQVCVIITNTAAPCGNGGGDLNTEIINKGDRIAQGVICPVIRVDFEEVESLDETDRGSNGFGSSGK